MSNVTKKHQEETDKLKREVTVVTEIANKNTSGWASQGGWGAPPPKTK